DGNDRITLGNPYSLDGFFSTLVVQGGAGTDTIILNDQGDTNANAYFVTKTDVRRNDKGLLYHQGAEGLTLNADNFADYLHVASTLATTPATFKMGGGDDLVEVGDFDVGGSLFAIQGGLTVDGQAGSNRLTLYDQGSPPLVLNPEGTAFIPVD